MVSLTRRLAPTGFKSSKPKIKSSKNLSPDWSYCLFIPTWWYLSTRLSIEFEIGLPCCWEDFSFICSTVSLLLIPNLSLILNAPNAMGNDFAGALISSEKRLAYSSSNYCQGIKSAIITHLFSQDNFPSNCKRNFDAEIWVCSDLLYRGTNNSSIITGIVMDGFYTIFFFILASKYISLVWYSHSNYFFSFFRKPYLDWVYLQRDTKASLQRRRR